MSMKVAFYKYTGRPGIAGLFDALIRKVTKGPYSHCELVFPDGWCYSASIQDGGTRFKKVAFDEGKWDFIELEFTREQMRKSEAFCLDERKCGYDYPGVFRFLVPAIRESKNRWFCSEIVCAALQEGGLLWGGVKPWQVHPSGLHNLLRSTLNG